MPFNTVSTNQPTTDANGLVGTPDTLVAISNAGVQAGVALGTAGTVLTSNGATSAPTFQSLGSVSGGGVIGTASFNPSTGSIVGLVCDGIISGVTYTSTGKYAVAFAAAEPNNRYTVDVTVSDDAVEFSGWNISGDATTYLDTGFNVQAAGFTGGAPAARDPQVVRIAVMRLSTGVTGPTGPAGPTGATGAPGGVVSVNSRTGVVSLLGTDLPTFVASGSSHAKGGVPDPGSLSGSTKFLCENASWGVPTGVISSVNTRTGAIVLGATDIPAFVASGTSHAPGAVPDPGGTSGTTKFLREDATWAVPAGGGGGGVTTLNSLSGALTIAAGTGITVTPSGSTITIAATGGGGGVSTVNTRSGAVVLGATDIPAFMASGSGHAAGAVPDPGGFTGTTKFLREDATWAIPSGGGGGAVTSVNTRTGAVVLGGSDIPAFDGDDLALLSGTDLFLACEDAGTDPINRAQTGSFVGTAITSVAGRFGKAYSFNGSSSKLAGLMYTPANIPTGQSFTMACWVNTTSTSEQAIMLFANSAETNAAFLWMSRTIDGCPIGSVSLCLTDASGAVFIPGPGLSSFFSTALVNDGAWHFIVAEKTPTAMTLYIDNVFDKTTSITDTAFIGDGAVAWVGTNASGGSQWFNGAIDEAQFYTRTLTTDEKTQLFTLGLASLGGMPVPGSVPAPTVGDGFDGKFLSALGGFSVPPVFVGDTVGASTAQVTPNLASNAIAGNITHADGTRGPEAYKFTWTPYVANTPTSGWGGQNGGAVPQIQWVIDFGQLVIATSYQLMGHIHFGGDLSPDEWLFEGSLDNHSFTTLDHPVSASTEEILYTSHVATPGAYRYYRFTFIKGNGGSTSYNLVMSDLQIFGFVGSTPRVGYVPAPLVGDAAAGKVLTAAGDWEVLKNFVPASRAAIVSSAITFWGCDESTGTTAADASGNSRTGTIASLTLGSSGVFNTGFFAGGAGSLTLPSASIPTLSAGSALSISVWFQCGAGQGGSLVCRRSSSYINALSMAVDPTIGTGVVWCNLYNGTNFAIGSAFSDFKGGTNLNDGQWHHGVFVKNNTAYQLWIDTVMVASATGTDVTIAAQDLTIGVDPFGTPAFYTGGFDEVGYWHTALTEADIVALFNATQPAGAGGTVPAPSSSDVTAGAILGVFGWQAPPTPPVLASVLNSRVFG